MRWITTRLRACFARGADERGASAIVTALLLTVFLGCVAVVVDVGMLHVERAQLQNGADTAALSVAYSCGQSIGSADCQATAASAAQLSNSNSLDHLSHISELKIDTTAGTVHVKNVAQQPGRDTGSIALSFAQVFGIQEAAVSAEASAIWGNPVAGLTPFPIVFSECEIKGTTNLQLVRFRKQGSFSPGCLGGPPGGFGNLDQVGSKCEASVDINNTASGSSTGNGIPANCDDLLKSWGTSIQTGQYPVGLFPVYKSVSESGSKAIYSLSGFAAFEIHGWKLKQGASAKYPELFRADYYSGQSCDKDCIGIIGKFIRHVSLDEDFILGTGGKDMGAYLVRLRD
jgi:hypothetical protein